MQDNYRIKIDLEFKDFIDLIDATASKKLTNAHQILSMDTRSLKKGDIFLALKGKKSDGHDFIKEASQKGASAVIVSKENIQNLNKKSLIYVDNTLSALEAVAKFQRRNSKASFIAITGSIGKTSTKVILNSALSCYGKSYMSPESFNNKWGVPISLSKAPKDMDYAIIEVGMNNTSEIEPLAQLVSPEIAIITNIGEAHIGNMGSIKNIAIEKSKIMNGMTAGGHLIMNLSSRYANLLHQKALDKKLKVITFGKNQRSDIYIRDYSLRKGRGTLSISVFGELCQINSDIKNVHLFDNIMPVLGVIKVLGYNLKDCLKNIGATPQVKRRWDVLDFKIKKGKIQVIDDTYNASPTSMLMAIESLSEYSGKEINRRIAILGDMLELGKYSRNYHSKLIKKINNSNLDKVYLFGNMMTSYAGNISGRTEVVCSSSIIELFDNVISDTRNGDLFLVKGGNELGLNKIIKDFINYFSLHL